MGYGYHGSMYSGGRISKHAAALIVAAYGTAFFI